MTSTLPAAVLWDMDGTIINTEPLWHRAEDELAAQFGVSLSATDRDAMVGMGLWDAARLLRGHGIDMEPDALVASLTDRVASLLTPAAMPWRPGALDLLAGLHDAGVPVALVTMSTRSLTEAIMAQLPVPPFQALIVGDEVSHAKPHPDAYLRGAAALGVDIAACVAIEDSVTGLRSAIASGAATIGVPHEVEITHLPATVFWSTLAGRTVADVAEVAAQHRAQQSR